MGAESTRKLLLLVLFAAAGCSSSASMESWQRGVERYVAVRKDPNVLRDVTVSGTRRGFAVIGSADPRSSTDAKGVLLGHKMIDRRAWFIYLVGLVSQQKVTEIHLAAVSFANGKPQWVISPKNPKTLAQYQHYNENLWRQKHGPQGKPPADYTTFPREADAFELTGEGTKIFATHPPSGAKWTADLAHPQGH